jgi:hypothetical protein
MTTWPMMLKVVRYHLIQRTPYFLLTWGLLAFTFVVDVAVLAMTPDGHGEHRYVGGLGSIVFLMFALGAQSVARSLPFALSLGFSRRTYYLGTATLAAALAACYGVVILVGQHVERATHGWGMRMGYFQVPYVLSGPWYLTLLTSFVGLTLAFAYGMWFGLVHRRWSLTGLVAFIAVQVAVLTLGAMVVTWAHSWARIGRFFATLSAAGLTGVLAVGTLLLLAGGFTAIRRLTI